MVTYKILLMVSETCVVKMNSGPGHEIPQNSMLVLHDTIVQLGQVAMELNGARGK